MTPSRKALRDATAAAHDRVDLAFAGFDVTDRADYARFLEAHAEVVWPLEAVLPGERVIADWPERKRGALLREDLALLGSAFRHRRESADPRSRKTSPETSDLRIRGDDEATIAGFVLDGDAAIAGTLYVLEGSRLGGRFIARQLPSGFPRAYLDADQRMERWQQLLSRIESILREPAALDSAVTAALAVFSAFERAAMRGRKVEFDG